MDAFPLLEDLECLVGDVELVPPGFLPGVLDIDREDPLVPVVLVSARFAQIARAQVGGNVPWSDLPHAPPIWAARRWVDG
jgi:hypothetical protein